MNIERPDWRPASSDSEAVRTNLSNAIGRLYTSRIVMLNTRAGLAVPVRRRLPDKVGNPDMTRGYSPEKGYTFSITRGEEGVLFGAMTEIGVLKHITNGTSAAVTSRISHFDKMSRPIGFELESYEGLEAPPDSIEPEALFLFMRDQIRQEPPRLAGRLITGAYTPEGLLLGQLMIEALRPFMPPENTIPGVIA
jgi:hypothetical protein